MTWFEGLPDGVVPAIAELGRLAADFKVVECGPVDVVQHDGKLVDVRALIEEPAAATLRVGSLTGVLDYCEANVDQLDLARTLILVPDVTHVVALSALRMKRDREHFILATAPEVRLPFGNALQVPEFIVFVGTRFVDTPERAALLALVSTLVQGETATYHDDGISQQVVVQQRAGIREATLAQAVHYLRPFRTFREIDQPMGVFLLRVNTHHKPLTVELHDADGNMWETVARKSIADYLRTELQKRKDIPAKVLA